MCLPSSLLVSIHLVIIFLCYHRIDAQGFLYDNVVIFGNSNSDNGNVYNMTNGGFPPSPYFQGRFSNDHVWAERLNVSQIVDCAYGGATTDNDMLQGYAFRQTIPVPGVRQQIRNYSGGIQVNRTNFNRTLYVIWAGGNNFLRNRTGSSSVISQSISNATKDVISFGGKNIVIMNQPPLQFIPLIRPTATLLNAAQLTSDYNGNLSGNIAALQQNNKDRKLQIFDLHALVSKVFANISSYGIQNAIDPCFSQLSNGTPQVCSNPNSYAFFDNIHFTGRMHQIIADEFKKLLISSSSLVGHFSSASSIFIVLSATLVLLIE